MNNGFARVVKISLPFPISLIEAAAAIVGFLWEPPAVNMHQPAMNSRAENMISFDMLLFLMNAYCTASITLMGEPILECLPSFCQSESYVEVNCIFLFKSNLVWIVVSVKEKARRHLMFNSRDDLLKHRVRRNLTVPKHLRSHCDSIIGNYCHKIDESGLLNVIFIYFFNDTICRTCMDEPLRLMVSAPPWLF